MQHQEWRYKLWHSSPRHTVRMLPVMQGQEQAAFDLETRVINALGPPAQHGPSAYCARRKRKHRPWPRFQDTSLRPSAEARLNVHVAHPWSDWHMRGHSFETWAMELSKHKGISPSFVLDHVYIKGFEHWLCVAWT